MAVKVSTSPAVTGFGVALNVRVVEMGSSSKVAVTAWAALMVTVQLPTPLHIPDQPLKMASLAAVAVNVTTRPLAMAVVQVRLQLTSPPLLLTPPFPSPTMATVRASLGPAMTKLTDSEMR